MRKLFTEHPLSVGETYGGHCVSACGFGLRLIWAGLACCLHGFLPFLCVTTGSRTVKRLYERMVLQRTATVSQSSSNEGASNLR
jgi:hypothetical protein